MRRTLFASFLFVLLAGPFLAWGQTKLPPTPADYGKWETLLAMGRGGFGPQSGGLSPDGKWLAYGINRSNGENELRITRIADAPSHPKVVAFGAQAIFSADSQWIAYSLGYSEAQQEKMRKEKKPIHNKLGLMKLATGEQTVLDGIQTFAFSPAGTWIAMRRYPAEKAGAAPADSSAAGPEDETPAGATLIVRQLSDGRDTTFGNVAEYAWQDLHLKGHLLALTISAEDKAGNGVQIFDTDTASLRVLDSAPAVYSQLAWRKDSEDLAVLRSQTDEKRDGPTQRVLAWSGNSVRTYDPTADKKFPSDLRIVAWRKPAWSEDGAVVFVGTAAWYEKPAAPQKGDAKSADAEEPAAVDVWHWKDTLVMARQKKGAAQDARRNMLAAWHVGSGEFVQLGHSLTERVTPLKTQKRAYAVDWTAYAMERSIGRPAADLYLVDIATGQRSKIKERLSDDEYLRASPGGKYLMYLEADQYWTVDTATGSSVNITKNIKTSFVDKESDETVSQKPPFGVAGWTKNDAEVILYDKFDLWKVTPDGQRSTRLTDGAAESVRHRYVQLDRDEEFIDLEKPVYLSLFGIWSKKSGYATLQGRLLYADKAIGRLDKAKDADVFSYVAESTESSPNIFVAGADLKEAKAVTQTNAFQSDYAWTHSELIEYKSPAGVRLQGVLTYPNGYEPGKKYPMVVYLYERLSDGLHRYSALSERNYYNPGAITSHGYFLLQPDIVFRPREPGLSVAECVSAAVKKVIEMGAVDAKKIGVVGHSWGGFDTAFLTTHTSIFAAGVAGAPITDLVSNYGNHHWSSGIAETDHIETGQQRMEVPLYEDLQAYIRNSAVYNVQNMTTPLLIEVGDADGTVFYHQGVELYNIARRAKKNVVLLVYSGEDHGLRKKADQIDYQRRIFAWFGYYLQGEAAAPWITSGESYLDHQREMKKGKTSQPQ